MPCINLMTRIILALSCLAWSRCYALPISTGFAENEDSVADFPAEPEDQSLENKQENVCLTKKCREVSAWIKKAINETVNPCEDFYEYACGQWMKDHTIPKGKLQISSFTEVRDKNNEAMKEALVTDDNLNTIDPIKKVRTFFQSCLDTKAIDDLGKEPIKNYINTLDSWSVDKEGGWNSEKWDTFKTLRKIQKEYTTTNLFFTVETIPDPLAGNETEKKNILMVKDILMFVAEYRNKKISQLTLILYFCCFQIDKASLDLHPIFFLGSPKVIFPVGFHLVRCACTTVSKQQLGGSWSQKDH